MWKRIWIGTLALFLWQTAREQPIDSSFTYTQSDIKIAVLASILVNTVGYVLSECKLLRKKL